MTPAQILAAVQACATAISEVFRWLQTPQGQAVVSKSLEDRENWDKFWASVADGVAGLFTGRIFRAPNP